MRHQYYLYFQPQLHVLPGIISKTQHLQKSTSQVQPALTHWLSDPQPHSSLKNLPHPLLLDYLLAEEVSSPLKYSTESIYTCGQMSFQVSVVELTCWTIIHTLWRWCLLYWHFTLQLLWSQSLKLKSLLWRRPENSTVSISSSPVSQGQAPVPSLSRSLSHFQVNKEVLPSLPHCLSGRKWCVYTDTENTRLHNHEKLKWHSWSANWTS